VQQLLACCSGMPLLIQQCGCGPCVVLGATYVHALQAALPVQAVSHIVGSAAGSTKFVMSAPGRSVLPCCGPSSMLVSDCTVTVPSARFQWMAPCSNRLTRPLPSSSSVSSLTG